MRLARLRFSIRGLMIAVAIIGGLLGLLANFPDAFLAFCVMSLLAIIISAPQTLIVAVLMHQANRNK